MESFIHVIDLILLTTYDDNNGQNDPNPTLTSTT